MLSENRQFDDVRDFLGERFNDLKTEGEAVDLAFELVMCLSMIGLSVSDPETFFSGVKNALDTAHESFIPAT